MSGLLLDNRNGFCRDKLTPSEYCFDSWPTLDTNSLLYDEICPEGVCDGMAESRKKMLEALNVFFTVIFILEMCLKIFAAGILTFAGKFENLFDSLVVFVSFLDICAAFPGQSGITALRFLRVLRMARLLRNLSFARLMTSALKRAGPHFLSLAVILSIFVFMSAQAGSDLFGGLLHSVPTYASCQGCHSLDQLSNPNCDPALCNMLRTNFDSYLPGPSGYGGIVTVVALITRERWSALMKMSSEAGIGWSGDLYFLAVFVIGQFLVLNLFGIIMVTTYIEVINEERQPSIAPTTSWTLTQKWSIFYHDFRTMSSSNLQRFCRWSGFSWVKKAVYSIFFEAGQLYSRLSQRVASFRRSNAVQDSQRFTVVSPNEPDQPKSKNILFQYIRLAKIPEIQFVVFLKVHCKALQNIGLTILISKEFEAFIFIFTIISASFVLAENPLELRTECCPESFQMITNASFYKDNRFCYRGNRADLTCSGHGVCKVDGSCFCEAHHSGEKCQCQWLSAFSCPQQSTLLRHSASFNFFRAVDYMVVVIIAAEAVMKIFCFGLLSSGVTRHDQSIASPYLNDPFSTCEGFILILSICALTWNNPGRESVRTLRLLNAFRAVLILLNRSKAKELASVFIKYAASIFIGLVSMMSVILLFSVISLQLFAGRLHSCKSTVQYPLIPIQVVLSANISVHDVLQCVDNGGVWEPPTFAFDSIFDSLLLMVLITTDGWIDVVDLAVDATSAGKSPIPMHSPWTSWFFVIYILIAKALLLHVFLSIFAQQCRILENFSLFLPCEKESSSELNKRSLAREETDVSFDYEPKEAVRNYLVISSSKSRSEFRSTGLLTCSNSQEEDHLSKGSSSKDGIKQPKHTDETPELNMDPFPTSDARIKKASTLVGTTASSRIASLIQLGQFDWFLNFLVLVNFVLLSLDTFSSGKYMMATYVDLFFSTLYLAEMLSKTVIYGVRRILSCNWDVFDAVVSLLSFTFAVVRLSIAAQGPFDGVPTLSMLRSVRFLRLCLVPTFPDSWIKSYEALSFSTLYLRNLLASAVFTWLSYSALGIGAFYNVRWAKSNSGQVDINTNFQNIVNAFLALLPVSAGDGWLLFMSSTSYNQKDYACLLDLDLDGSFENESGCGGKVVSVLYFISFFFIHNFLYMNMVITTIIAHYVKATYEEMNPNQETHPALVGLLSSYVRLDRDQYGMIETRRLRDLFIHSSFRVCNDDLTNTKAIIRFIRAVTSRLSIRLVRKYRKNDHLLQVRYATLPSIVFASFKILYPKNELPSCADVLYAVRVAYAEGFSDLPDLLDQTSPKDTRMLQDHAAQVLQFALVTYMVKLQTNFQFKSMHSTVHKSASLCQKWSKIWRRLSCHHRRLFLSLARGDHWGCVYVSLVSAKHLQAKKHLRKCDPFAVISCCGDSIKSATLVNTNDPIWDQKFDFMCNVMFPDIEVDIYDDHSLQPELIGRIIIPVSTVCLAPKLKVQQWYKLPLQVPNENAYAEESFVFLEIEVKIFKWSLGIRVLSCKELPEHNLDEKLDLNPYVSVFIENQRYYGNPVFGSANPCFKDRMTFWLSSLNEDIRLLILNNQPSDINGDGFLGQLKLNLSSIFRPENLSCNFFGGGTVYGVWETTKWYPLQDKDGHQPWAQANINIIEAKNLPKLNILGKMDSYCVIRMVQEDGVMRKGQRTSVQHSTFHPVWNHEFVYCLSDQNSYILLEIFNHDLDGSQTFIGSSKILLSELQNQNETNDAWYEILPAEGRSPPIVGSLGSIRVSVAVQTEGKDFTGNFGYICVEICGKVKLNVPHISDFHLNHQLLENEPNNSLVLRSPSDLLNISLKIAIVEAVADCHRPAEDKSVFYCTVDSPRNHFKTCSVSSKTSTCGTTWNPRWCEEFLMQQIESGTCLEISLVSTESDMKADEVHDMVVPFVETANFLKNTSRVLGAVRIHASELWALFQECKTLQSSDEPETTNHGQIKCDKWYALNGSECEASIRIIFTFVALNQWDQSLDQDAFEMRNAIRKILNKKKIRAVRLKQRQAVTDSHRSDTKSLSSVLAALWKPITKFRNVWSKKNKRKFLFHNPTTALKAAGVSETLFDGTRAERFPQIQNSEAKSDPIRYLEATGRIVRMLPQNFNADYCDRSTFMIGNDLSVKSREDTTEKNSEKFSSSNPLKLISNSGNNDLIVIRKESELQEQ